MTENQTALTLQRIRLVFSRDEALRYVSHLDMHLVWERTLRRARLPLAYSKGFNPNPRLHQAAALPLGFLSSCEVVDFWLETPEGQPALLPEQVAIRVQDAAPPGMKIMQGEVIPLNLPALQTLIKSAEYLATPLDPISPAELTNAVEQILASPALPRERRGKKYDLRPLIEALEARQNEDGQTALWMRLAAREGATGRPEEVLDQMQLNSIDFRVERSGLILSTESAQ